MKNIVLGMTGLFVLIYTLMLGLNILTVTNYKNQLECNLSRIVKNVLEYGMKSKDEEIVKQILDEEIQSVVSKSISIEIEILHMDLEKGILSVQVIEHIPMLMTSTKEIRMEKTVILERMLMEHKMVTIEFWVNGELYKMFEIKQGESCPLPKSPDGNFVGWKAKESELMLEEPLIKEVWENQIYEAVFEKNKANVVNYMFDNSLYVAR